MKEKTENIRKLINQGEGLDLEFKESRNGLNKNVFETVCAFLNRHGGTLLLGVRDSGEIVGIAPENLKQIKKDFITSVNNPQKIYPTCYLCLLYTSDAADE